MIIISTIKKPEQVSSHFTNVRIDSILGYKRKFDKKLDDPVWQLTSMKMTKYGPFLNTDVFRFKKILKQVVLGER